MRYTEVKNSRQAVIEYLETLDYSELVAAHNTYCEVANYNDDVIHINDEDFFETYFSNKPIEAVRAAQYGDYNVAHDYVVFNGYANLVSLNDPSEHVSLTEIADCILKNPNCFGIELIEDEERLTEEA